MFNFFKPTFQFEVIHSDNIKKEKINTPAALVNYVIGANNHLIKAKDTGWIYSEKIKKTKKGNETVYALKIELPIYEDNLYFDQLLAPFYTKKKVYFEEIVLSEATNVVNDQKTTNEIPEIPEELKQMAESGLERLESEVIDSIALEEIDENMQITKPSASLDEVDQLKKQLLVQQQEIEQLKKKESDSVFINQQEIKLSEQKETSELTEESEVDSKGEYAGLSLDTLPPSNQKDFSVSEASGAVNDVLSLIKKEFSTRLSNFVEEETEKIDQEVKKLDTRHLIEGEVSKRIQVEKTKTIESEQALLETERQVKLTEEQQRYEAAVSAIERNYLEKKGVKEQELNTYFAEKLDEDIANEYKIQTEQLTRILQGKKDELAFKQKEMNEGLKQDFTQVLATFNESHEKVIQHMEQQKVANQPIDFLKRKKAVSE